MTSSGSRVTDYDSIAARYDRRYAIHEYAGVRAALVDFVGESSAVLEVGCGTGHWLGEVTRSANLSGKRMIAGVEPSAEMIVRARTTAPDAQLVRARAEELPWHDASFDRLYCVNALHHFSDRARFFAEARRILKPGGALLTIGKDPHAERDSWWVYDYFPETVAIDRERFARVRTLRGEMTLAGFSWSESFEADRIEAVQPATEALASGIVDRAYTSQLTVLSDEEFAAGVARMKTANDAAGGQLPLVTDFYLFATVGWT
ncbi:MAG: class I SAM-dependent methyltransferase [Acidobacteria bacterium]|nr:class I SAM-dependent methyltransferase [Acidobacteriota bacterium]